MKKLYLIGGGGHCKSCIDVIEGTNNFIIKGIFDKSENISKRILNYSIIGSDEDLIKFISPENYFLITVGQIKSAEARVRIFENLKTLNANIATVVSLRSYVSKYAKIGKGTIVMHDSFVNANAVIGDNCILNTKSLVEHDSRVADHCHISTGAIVNGDCFIEGECFIGSNAVLREGIRVPAKTIVSAGSFYNGK